jgi:hypothetical protein
MFGTYELVLHGFGHFECSFQSLVQSWIHVRRATARHLGQTLQFILNQAANLLSIRVDLFEDSGNTSIAVLQEGFEEYEGYPFQEWPAFLCGVLWAPATAS